ncbi:hypothetical protein CVT24_005949 [Panaeolus cyanescens]|uniref:Late embryogenesis abundant protein LEA-2 subgroup domain-containing protein n=1 Tax=Panaeolus cyanescens TaxID=181874 RepID=A0A409V8Z3_9AGAR|nr:hypothetical protein CVT24_005949 [Panaeolus cyanescens]
MDAPMSDWFRSIPSALDAVTFAAKYQQETMASQIRFYKSRHTQFRQFIERLRRDVAELKRSNEKLQAENQEYRQRLGLGAQYAGTSGESVNPNGKRAMASDSHHLFRDTRPRTDSSPRSITTPLGPNRLTLPPGQSHPEMTADTRHHHQSRALPRYNNQHDNRPVSNSALDQYSYRPTEKERFHAPALSYEQTAPRTFQRSITTPLEKQQRDQDSGRNVQSTVQMSKAAPTRFKPVVGGFSRKTGNMGPPPTPVGKGTEPVRPRNNFGLSSSSMEPPPPPPQAPVQSMGDTPYSVRRLDNAGTRNHSDPYSYNTHYAGNTNYHQNSQSQYPTYPSSTTYPATQAYDNAGNDFNPYGPNVEYRQDHPPTQHNYQYDYDQYKEDNLNDQTQYNYPPSQPSQRQPSRHSKKHSANSISVTPVRKAASGFDQGEFTPTVPTQRRPKTASALRNYRLDHQGNLWTKVPFISVFYAACLTHLLTRAVEAGVLEDIVLALALWVRPPSVKIWPVQLINNADGSPITQDSGGISINFGVNITVNNPNYFAADFKKIEAEILYPLEGSDDAPIGGGSLSNIVFESTSQKNVTFPFALTYKSAEDPQGKIILDLATKCGFNGGQKSNINVKYKLTLGIRIIIVTISPVITNSFSFLCPLEPSDIGKFINGGSN